MVPNAQDQVEQSDKKMPRRNSGFKKSWRCSLKMTQMPAKPSNKPAMALGRSASLPVKRPMMTSHSGNMAPMMEPSPAEIYFTPQVDRALLSMKFKKLSIRMIPHSLPFG